MKARTLKRAEAAADVRDADVLQLADVACAMGRDLAERRARAAGRPQDAAASAALSAWATLEAAAALMRASIPADLLDEGDDDLIVQPARRMGRGLQDEVARAGR